MIEVSLCVDDICHNCPKFEPNYQHIQLKSGSGEIEPIRTFVVTLRSI